MNKLIKYLCLLISLLAENVSMGQANAGPDQTICKGQKIYLGEPNSSSNAACVNTSKTYSWTIISGDKDMSHISCTACSKPEVNPDITTTYRYSISGETPPTDDVTITVLNLDSVRFLQDTPTHIWKWGMDDWTNFGSKQNNGSISNTEVRWISIEKGQKDYFALQSFPNSLTNPECLYVESSESDSLFISNPQVNANKFAFEIEAKCNNNSATPKEYSIWARYGKGGSSVQPANSINPISKVDVVEYMKPIVKIRFVRVNLRDPANPANNFTTKNISPMYSQIIDSLNNRYYNQAVVQFANDVVENFDLDSNFDRNGDGKLASWVDLNGNGQVEEINEYPEMDSIILKYQRYIRKPTVLLGDTTFVYFLVDSCGFNNVGIARRIGGNYCFINTRGFSLTSSSLRIQFYMKQSFAHELGHCLNLRHAVYGTFQNFTSCCSVDASSQYIDPTNIMDYCDECIGALIPLSSLQTPNGCRPLGTTLVCSPKATLRKFQWDITHNYLFNNHIQFYR